MPRGGVGRREILIRLCPPQSRRYPFLGWKRHRSSPVNHDWQNWREALVALAAHEGRHIDLYIHNYDKGFNSQAVEQSCEAWENKRLREYRELLAG